jgi:glycosyltransferase involved in cell wall biosynthesis
MRIAEVWGTTLAEVELDDTHWLQGDDTYHQLSQRRVARGHHNLVCLIEQDERKSGRRDGVQYEFFPADPGASGQFGPRSTEMLSFLARWRPDVLLLHSANQVQTLLCLRERVPGTRYVLASNSAATTGIVLDEIAHDPGLVSACTFKAQIVRDHFCAQTGYPKAHTHILPSGIDLEQFKPLALEKDLDGIWVGYMRENNYRKKNLPLLLEAFCSLEARLLIVGRGNAMASLRQAAPSNVTFCGFVKRRRLPHLLARSKVFIQPSLFDPAPRAVSEALACGLPVVGLRKGYGTEEQILDGVNGYRVNTLAEMREAVQSLLVDDQLRQRMGRESRSVAERHFNIDVIDHKLQALLKEIVGRDPTAHC